MTLRDARKARSLTQVQLAELAEVEQTTISDIETGRNRNPSWTTVKRLAQALGVAAEQLEPLSDAVTS